jgi:hypothetical protein
MTGLAAQGAVADPPLPGNEFNVTASLRKASIAGEYVVRADGKRFGPSVIEGVSTPLRVSLPCSRGGSTSYLKRTWTASSVAIRTGHFKSTQRKGTLAFTIDGRFTRGGTRAEGTIRLSGRVFDYYGNAYRCDTRALRFAATGPMPRPGWWTGTDRRGRAVSFVLGAPTSRGYPLSGAAMTVTEACEFADGGSNSSDRAISGLGGTVAVDGDDATQEVIQSDLGVLVERTLRITGAKAGTLTGIVWLSEPALGPFGGQRGGGDCFAESYFSAKWVATRPPRDPPVPIPPPAGQYAGSALGQPISFTIARSATGQLTLSGLSIAARLPECNVGDPMDVAVSAPPFPILVVFDTGFAKYRVGDISDPWQMSLTVSLRGARAAGAVNMTQQIPWTGDPEVRSCWSGDVPFTATRVG